MAFTFQDNLIQMQQSAKDASELLKLLANQHRLLILCHLLNEPLSVKELQTRVGLSQSALSQHLAKMRQEGLLSTEKKSTQVFYQINQPDVVALMSTLHLIFCRPTNS